MPCRLLAHNPSIASKSSSDSRFPPIHLGCPCWNESIQPRSSLWRLTGSYPRSRVPVILKAQRHAGTDHLPPAPLGSARRSARGLWGSRICGQILYRLTIDTVAQSAFKSIVALEIQRSLTDIFIGQLVRKADTLRLVLHGATVHDSVLEVVLNSAVNGVALIGVSLCSSFVGDKR
jgi:hypothetical protein